MKKILDLIGEQVRAAFESCGYAAEYGKVTLSNRPDLCEYQCNGALAAAKVYRKKPIDIANDVAGALIAAGLREPPVEAEAGAALSEPAAEAEIAAGEREQAPAAMFAEVTAAMPGFLNLKLSSEFLAAYLEGMRGEEKLGVEECGRGETILVDYGGANVAKPLHVGHLRTAIIGECVKRMGRYLGYRMIGDVHLGDWGLQMGLVIEELRRRKPDLPYFDETFTGEYPSEPPFTLSELEEIYPAASARSKEDEDFKARAQEATYRLQDGYEPYRAIWRHIMNVSVADLKKNYGALNVTFDLWKGESDAMPYIPWLIEDLQKKGLAHESEGALVVDIARPDDPKELPPCIIRKSNGAALYATSDLGTIIERERDYAPAEYIYITDKRQELHMTQVFRVAKMAGYVKPETRMTHLMCGTMNGKDGKPFKTRAGGVMRLEDLIRQIDDAAYSRIMENRTMDEREAAGTARIVGLAALKYGDLSNQVGKDYVFDIDRFTSFEGNTGPYILYTIVRIKSILAKYEEGLSGGAGAAGSSRGDGNGEAAGGKAGAAGSGCGDGDGEAAGGKAGAAGSGCGDGAVEVAGGKAGAAAADGVIPPAETAEEKTLMLKLSAYNEVVETAFAEKAPHKLCQFIYELSDAFGGFYNTTMILKEEDAGKKAGYIRLIGLVKDVLENCIDLLGFEAPERM